MRALILCAGRGTRLGLKRTPKVMVKVNGKPVLEHLVNHLNKAGITEIIVNISSHSDYTKIFRYFGTRLLYFYEPTLLGEAGTERMLQNWLGDEYVVMNGDTLTNVDIAKLVESSKNGHCFFLRLRNPINGHYAGTTVVNKKAIILFDKIEGYAEGVQYLEDDEYYYDIGTPQKLAKARKALKK